MFDFVRVACVTLKTYVCDTQKNCEEILNKIDTAIDSKADIVVFPELCVTGVSCGDMFFQNSLINNANFYIDKIVKHTKSKGIVVFVGSPVEIDNKLYNCGIAIYDGKIIGITPKTYLDEKDSKHFSSSYVLSCDKVSYNFQFGNDDYDIPVGNDLIFNFENKLKIGCEIGNDMYSPIPLNACFSLNGADIIINLGADIETGNSHIKRNETIKNISEKNICGYCYTSAGSFESTTDVVFSGHKIICENGNILSENNSVAEIEGMIISDIDIEKIRNQRKKSEIFKITNIPFKTRTVNVSLLNEFNGDGTLKSNISSPFLPIDKNEQTRFCEELFKIQVVGLKKRLSVTNAKAVVGVSGGLDSTLALLVCTKAMEELNRPLSDVVGITMPGFGTTDRTHDNSISLMKNLGIDFKEISIKKSCELHFEDINHDVNIHDLTYENSQARERTQILMDYAGKIGGMVIGTGDMSELCLGWCTYNGDQMSMYGVNSGIPKTVVKEITKTIAKNNTFPNCSEILNDIVNTPISPELLPPNADGKIKQKTEDIVGPYELHDFFIYFALKYGFTPSKIYHLAKLSFKDVYDNEFILKWLKNFYKRFFSQQFKRSCSPDGIKVLDISISPRGGLVMPSDACVNIWIKEVENLRA